MRTNITGGNGALRSSRTRLRAVRAWALAATAALSIGTMTAAASASARQTSAARMSATAYGQAKAPAKVDYRRACAAPSRGHVACLVLIRTNVRQRRKLSITAIPAGVGYGPADLQSAYGLPSSTAGAGQTVAIIDSYDYPTAASDLAAYRSAAGLPACGTGCFTKVNQNGQASPLPQAAGTTGWDVEEALDIDMVSATCPLCHIILVEADSPTFQNLGTAVNSAVSLGAKFVSNSYGGSESSSDPSFDSSFYNHPGVAVTASAGDSGFGVEYPAASQFVTAVGGTSLSTAANARGWSETVWNGTGSGCSAYDAKPSWQTDTGCAGRTSTDVSAVADPNTGVAIYNTYSQGGWLEVGGTSVSSPIIASVFALAGTPAAGTYPSSYIYAHISNLFDVTSGSNGTCSPAYLCTGEAGYDGPTGWGTPNGTTAFTAGGGGCTVTQLLGNPGFETGSAAPWTTSAAVINANSVFETSHSGTWYAWLDGYGTTHTDNLVQTVTIPAGCIASTFSFWLHIDTAETTTTTANDKLTVSAGGTTLAIFSNLDHASGYTQHTYSLAGLTGTVNIKFKGNENSSLQTSFVVDDTAVTTG